MEKFIWTHHALARLNERKISGDLAIATLTAPDKTIANSDQTIKFQKSFQTQTATVIAKENENGQYIILSYWIDPPNPGTKDYRRKARYNEIKKASTLRKLWLTFLDQIGF